MKWQADAGVGCLLHPAGDRGGLSDNGDLEDLQDEIWLDPREAETMTPDLVETTTPEAETTTTDPAIPVVTSSIPDLPCRDATPDPLTGECMGSVSSQWTKQIAFSKLLVSTSLAYSSTGMLP